MLFGTYFIAPGDIPAVETRTSERMQEYFLDFVVDPASLPEKGWPAFRNSSDGGGRIARFGADGSVLQIVNGSTVDGACYNSSILYDTTP